jgi:hypothetical protein
MLLGKGLMAGMPVENTAGIVEAFALQQSDI